MALTQHSNLKQTPKGIIFFGNEPIGNDEHLLDKEEVEKLYTSSLTWSEAIEIHKKIESRLEYLFYQIKKARHLDGEHIQIHDPRDEISEAFHRGNIQEFQGMFTLTCSLLKPVPGTSEFIHVGAYPIPVQWLYESATETLSDFYPLMNEKKENAYHNEKISFYNNESKIIDKDEFKLFLAQAHENPTLMLNSIYCRIYDILTQLENHQNRTLKQIEIWNPFQLMFQEEEQNYFNPREHLITIPLIIQSIDEKGKAFTYSLDIPTSWLWEDFKTHLKKADYKEGILIEYNEYFPIHQTPIGFDEYRQFQDIVEHRLSNLITTLVGTGLIGHGDWKTTEYCYFLNLNSYDHGIDWEKQYFIIQNIEEKNQFKISTSWLLKIEKELKKEFIKLNKLGLWDRIVS